MTYQYSVAVRNAKLDTVESTIGTAALLRLFSGAEPVNCAAADPAGLLATLTLPVDWMAAAAGGTKAKLGSWVGAGSANGTAASFRIYDSGAIACHIQGSVTLAGGGGDMTMNNVAIANGQAVTVNTFTLAAGNQ
jgi:hypothetical protein